MATKAKRRQARVLRSKEQTPGDRQREARRRQLAKDMVDSAKHRMRVGRRVHDLLEEIDLALLLYGRHVGRLQSVDAEQGVDHSRADADEFLRFRAALSRFRGFDPGAPCPIYFETVADAHVDRNAVAEVADSPVWSRRFVEQAVGRATGYASKPIDDQFPGQHCERCDGKGEVTAAVSQIDGGRRVVERQRLCLDCYDVAITEDE